MRDIFINTIKNHNLLKRKDKVILGISGGPDSIYMLHKFLEIKEEYKLNLVCAHFNHGLRPEADNEEKFVKKICKEAGLKCVSEKKDVNKFFQGDSLEQTARNLRYDFFMKVSRQEKIKKLSLAHHKDDLVETVLIRILRGSGLRGLRGFLPRSKYKGLTVIRPLIETSKKDIIDWLTKEKISYCIDKSNLEDKFLRNKVRLKLIPFLKEFNPNVTENIYNLAGNLCLDYDFIYKASFDSFNSLKRGETKKGIKLDLEGLKKLPQAMLNNVLRIAIEETKGNVRRLESRHLKEIIDLILSRPTASIVHLPDLLIKKEQDFLIISMP